MFVDGELSTFDFLPCEVKAYRDFKRIADLMAVAHFYNNLGAKVLLDDDVAFYCPTQRATSLHHRTQRMSFIPKYGGISYQPLRL